MAKTKVQVDYVPLQEPPRDPYSTEPTNYLQLLGSIQGAGTTNRLKHLVQHYGGAFDAAHLAAAIAVLPKLAQYRCAVTSYPLAGVTIPEARGAVRGRLTCCFYVSAIVAAGAALHHACCDAATTRAALSPV